MRPITMSQFVDYVLASGTGKLTAAKAEAMHLAHILGSL